MKSTSETAAIDRSSEGTHTHRTGRGRSGLLIYMLLASLLALSTEASAAEVLPIPPADSPSHHPSASVPVSQPLYDGSRRQVVGQGNLTLTHADDSASEPQVVLPNLEPTYPPDEHFDWDLVIVVPTHITEFSRRCAVRDSWARQLRGHEQGNRSGKRTVKLVFIVGAHAPDDRTRAMAEAEQRQFGDIHVLSSEFVDEYRSLATKTRLSMRDAVHNIGKFRLLLKTDTDSFVHLERLLKFIEKEGMWNDRRVYGGAFRTDVVEWRPEEKGSKWWDGDFKQMTGLEHYPYNAKGAGYIVSYDLAKYLADPPLPLRRWTHEDVGVGSWLMAIDHRRVSMPISFMTPECGCGATCDEDTFYQDEDDEILRKEPVVIDHYVPEYLQRWRQRRYELIGDACWASVADGVGHLPRDIIEVDDSHNSAFTTGMMGYTYRFHPLGAYGYPILPDHSDTRSGVCQLTFQWERDNDKREYGRSESPSPSPAAGRLRAASRREERDDGEVGSSRKQRFVVCRGSDGNEYDEFECTASSLLSIPSTNEDNRNQPLQAASMEASLQLQEDWKRLPEASPSACARPILVRDLIPLAECEELGRFYTQSEESENGPAIQESRILSGDPESESGYIRSTQGLLIAWSSSSPSPFNPGPIGQCTVYNATGCYSARYPPSAISFGEEVQVYRPSTDHLKPMKSPWSLSRRKPVVQVGRLASSRSTISGDGPDGIIEGWRWLITPPLICILVCVGGGLFLLRRWLLKRGGRVARDRRE